MVALNQGKVSNFTLAEWLDEDIEKVKSAFSSDSRLSERITT